MVMNKWKKKEGQNIGIGYSTVSKNLNSFYLWDVLRLEFVRRSIKMMNVVRGQQQRCRVVEYTMSRRGMEQGLAAYSRREYLTLWHPR